jgi:hypothetical protein
MTNQLIRNDQVVQSLSQAIAHGMGGIQNVPTLLDHVLEQDMWRRRIVQKTGEVVEFERFEDFVASHPPEGLGTSVTVLESICREHSPETLKRIRAAQSALAANGGNRQSVLYYNTEERQRGDSTSYKLARLKRDNPKLAERVIEGELSAHAAAVEAGFANPKISINLRNLESAAKTICRKLDESEVLELIDWLYKVLGEDKQP